MKTKILLSSLLLLFPFSAFAYDTLHIVGVKVNGESEYAVVKPERGVNVEVVLDSPIRYSASVIEVELFQSGLRAYATPQWYKSKFSTTSLQMTAPKEEGVYDVVVKVYEDSNRNTLLASFVGNDLLGVQTANYVKPEILATSTSKVEPSVEDLKAQLAYLMRVLAQLIRQLQYQDGK